jgi:hypothetical protein
MDNDNHIVYLIGLNNYRNLFWLFRNKYIYLDDDVHRNQFVDLVEIRVWLPVNVNYDVYDDDETLSITKLIILENWFSIKSSFVFANISLNIHGFIRVYRLFQMLLFKINIIVKRITSGHNFIWQNISWMIDILGKTQLIIIQCWTFCRGHWIFLM